MTIDVSEAQRVLRDAAREELLTVRELASIFDVSEDAIYSWIRKGAMPAVRVGPHQRVRVRVTVAAEFFASSSAA